MYSTSLTASAPAPAPEPSPVPASRRPRVATLDSFDAYGIAVSAVRDSSTFSSALPAHLRDQFNRAASSVALNIAEGFGSFSSGVKRRHYEIARGSAMECVAILDLVSGSESGSGSGSELNETRGLFTRCAMMLAKLVARFR